jgi:hypothetical protein
MSVAKLKSKSISKADEGTTTIKGVVVITMSNKNPKSLTVETPSNSGSRIPISPVASM